MTDPAETLKMFCEANKEDLVTGIEEDVIPTSELEDKMPVHAIPDEGERVRPNFISEKSLDLTYLKKDSDADMSAYEYSIKFTEEVRYIVKPNDAEDAWASHSGQLQSNGRHQSRTNSGTRR